MTTYIEKDCLQIVNGRKYHRDRRRYELGYCNTNEKLLREFSKDVLAVYKIKVRKRKTTDLVFKSKRVFSRIKNLGGGDSHGWSIGEEIFGGRKIVKTFWLRAFFDDEATVDRTNSVIRVKSVNRRGLNQVRQLMDTVGITSNIIGPNCDSSWYLTVPRRNLKKFQKTIGYNHPEKKLLLENILNGFT
ncbi:MAG TPA: LAGLIDADG family homing endonuclease [Candidatus Nitrosotalea sp.]|nr:LAGLIDADG family homing endonuclease [Candidatus Nitrosotalea sp.]